MKLVIDLLGAQTRSHLRGIGRYTRELTKALLRQAGEAHAIHLVLHAPLEQASDALIAEFGALLPYAHPFVAPAAPHLRTSDWQYVASSCSVAFEPLWSDLLGCRYGVA